MTRKDYVLIAEAIARQWRMASAQEPQEAGPRLRALELLTRDLIVGLADDNPRFDGPRFRAAALPNRVEN